MADNNDIAFVSVDADEIYSLIIGNLTSAVGEDLFPGDERRIFGEAMAATAVSLLNYLNDGARQRFLRYARGTTLDALGERVGVARIIAKPAVVTVRFSLQQIRTGGTIIPQNTKVADNRSMMFTTNEVAVIEAGKSYVDVICSSVAGGAAYNGIAPGSINRLIDLVPGIASVSNMTTSAGGDDGEEYTEAGDDHFRGRIRLASGSFSVAGSEQAYRFWALSADPNIAAVSIANPSDGVIQIVPIMAGGAMPTQDVLNRIVEICSDDKVRPITDQVLATTPNPHDFDINIVYYTTVESENAVVQSVESSGGALDRYTEWQITDLGRDINPDQLRRLVLDAGALRLDVTDPVFMPIDEYSVAQFSGNLTVTHKVVDG